MRLERYTTLLVIRMAILTTSLYVVARNLPPIVGSFRWLWGPLALLSIVLMKPSVFKAKSMLSLLLYGALSLGLLQNTLWSNMREWNRHSLLEEF